MTPRDRKQQRNQMILTTKKTRTFLFDQLSAAPEKKLDTISITSALSLPRTKMASRSLFSAITRKKLGLQKNGVCIRRTTSLPCYHLYNHPSPSRPRSWPLSDATTLFPAEKTSSSRHLATKKTCSSQFMTMRESLANYHLTVSSPQHKTNRSHTYSSPSRSTPTLTSMSRRGSQRATRK